ncbi:MAG: quinolinate synthase NadA [Thermodesulfobacteriota bacterium]
MTTDHHTRIDQLKTRIDQLKKHYSQELAILAHHYQQDEIVDHADFLGDSLELSRKIPQLEAKYVVMCGVYFMAESAAILAKDWQRVYIPEAGAGCVLSEMAPASLVNYALQRINIISGQKVIPLTYVNTSAAVKATTGIYGGAVCTSANAGKMLDWALQQGDSVLFLPDRNLGRNTAARLGVPEDEQAVLDLDNLRIPAGKRIYFWPGYCDVHERMKPEHIQSVRDSYPEAHVIVHPECPPEVVEKADASGSTSQIIQYVREREEGSTIFVGTEINMVQRLAKQYRGSKQILPLLDIHCKDMAKINTSNFLKTLQGLEQSQSIFVDGQTRKAASLALERMLQVCG